MGNDPENVAEDIKGRAKEAVGAVTGSDDLKREGEAQQEKAEKREEASDKAAEAQEAASEAAAKEAEQRRHQ